MAGADPEHQSFRGWGLDLRVGGYARPPVKLTLNIATNLNFQ